MIYTEADIKKDLLKTNVKEFYMKYLLRADNWYFERILNIDEKDIIHAVDDFKMLVSDAFDIGYYNMDCMIGMKDFPDKFFDLAIVDPPYFSGPERRNYYGRKVSPIGVPRLYGTLDVWEVPGEEYFRELIRVSKQQIIWGCNYFDWNFPPGRIVWDKCNGNSVFSDCEIASCSIHNSTRLFRYMWNGMFQGKSIEEGHIQQGNKKLNEKRIHPTQKPVNLYRWIIQKYIQPDWKVLDTHVGSASSLIALEEAGIPYVGFEIDSFMYQIFEGGFGCPLFLLQKNVIKDVKILDNTSYMTYNIIKDKEQNS